MINPNPSTPAISACTLLLRNVGSREDRTAKGGGFEDFRVGRAICIFATFADLNYVKDAVCVVNVWPPQK